MSSKLVVIALLLFSTVNAFAQTPIDLTEQTIKLGGMKEELLYYGFAEGDKIVFSFQEVGNKEVKEIEVIEYPSSSKFSDYKSKKIENKIINVPKTGVYVFRLKNTAISGRICKIKIQRIPANETTTKFNSAVNWVTRQDTTWNTFTKDVVVGYDTTYLQKVKRELVKTEQREESILDKTQRVHSQTNDNGNRTRLFFTLPRNEASGLRTKRVVSWAYWVGVNEAGKQAWDQNSKVLSKLVKGIATTYTTPLGALAIGAISDMATPKVGEDVIYGIADQENANLFHAGQPYKIYDEGKGVAGYKRFTDPGICQGTWYIILANDNFVDGIDATVKVVAIIETNIYEDKHYTEQVVSPRTEKQLFKEPVITSSEVPVTGI
ncbi:hypothetical protein [Cesiribacter sp. SM1]|uniref:hypothetical protein n=1 Tax=Cesiribacter sp. SM1 TaxID=2861196 RepID=UPI001CD4D221|nr:hypothetical protein [Cesiribacter sp. SM1]